MNHRLAGATIATTALYLGGICIAIGAEGAGFPGFKGIGNILAGAGVTLLICLHTSIVERLKGQ